MLAPLLRFVLARMLASVIPASGAPQCSFCKKARGRRPSLNGTTRRPRLHDHYHIVDDDLLH
eukprot:3294475-Pyramimonas_sp.AAC.1